MNRFMKLALFACASSTIAAPAVAQSLTVPVQGLLTNDADEPLEGDHELTIRLYEGADGTTALFEERQTASLSGGAFALHLGATKDLDPATIAGARELWLSIAIGEEEEMKPRLRIGTVPYAAHALSCAEATTLQGAAPEDFAMSNHTHAFSELTAVPATFPPAAHTHAFSELTDVPASFPSAWATLADVPADLADGDDDSFAQISCQDGDGLEWSAMGWICVAAEDPVTAVAAADEYVRNSGDAITGNISIDGSDNTGTNAALSISSGSQTMLLDGNEIDAIDTLFLNGNSESAVETGGDLRVEGALSVAGGVDPTMTGVGPATAPNRLLHRHFARIVNQGSTANYFNVSHFEDRCGDLDGCRVTVMEQGYDANQRALRRSSGVRHINYDIPSGIVTVDDASVSGTIGDDTMTVLVSIGVCRLEEDRLVSGAVRPIALTKPNGDTQRNCYLTIED